MFDYIAHQHLTTFPITDLLGAIRTANEKSHKLMGIYFVCITNAGDILVLPEFSAQVRDDISEFIYDTEKGYTLTHQTRGVN